MIWNESRFKPAQKARGVLIGFVVLLCGAVGGCEFKDSSFILTPYFAAEPVVESSWYLDQAATYADRGQPNKAELFMERFRLRESHWRKTHVEGDPEDFDQLLDKSLNLDLDRARSLERQIDDLRNRQIKEAEEEATRRREIESKLEALFENSDIHALTDGEVQDDEFFEEVERQKAELDENLAPRILNGVWPRYSTFRKDRVGNPS